jgi:DNA-binding response OmpR family regulator
MPETEILAKILIVRGVVDEELSLLVEHFGFVAVSVDCGVAAIQAVQDYEFAAVLLDSQLIDMATYECATRMREVEGPCDSRMPIIMVPSRSDFHTCTDAIDDYLEAPLSRDKLRRLLLRWTYDAKKPNLKLLPGQ